jgi:hypothetical protein
MVKYIIVGCGRSGTGFMSHMFNYNNIKCGHENIFGLTLNFNTKFVADSSWLSAPYLKEHQNASIVFVIRNPVDVIKSFLDLNLFSIINDNSPYILFIKKYINIDLHKLSDIENTISYYVQWNNYILNTVKNMNYEIVSFDDLIKQKSVELHHNVLNVPKKNINTKKDKKIKNISTQTIINNNNFKDAINTYKKILNDEHRKV